jgi:DNA transformation protein
MAVSESFLTFVLEQLEGVRQITSRRMFGGVGLYSGDQFFGLIDNDRLYFKVDESTVGDYIRAGMGAFRPDPKQPTTMTYCEVPVAVLEDRDELAKWASDSIRAAEASKGSKGSAGSTRSKSSTRSKGQGRSRVS